MRILILDSKAVRRGAQVFAADLAKGLRSRGHEVLQVYLYGTNDEGLLNEADGAMMLGFDDKHPLERWLTLQPQALRALLGVVEQFNPEVMLLNGSRSVKYGAWAKRLARYRFKLAYRVIDSAAYWNSRGLTRWYYNALVMPLMDAVIAVSKASLEDSIRLYGRRRIMEVIHRSFDPKKFISGRSRAEARALLGVAEHEKIVLFLGRLVAQKRPDRLVQIADHFRENTPSVQFWMVGDGELRASVEAAIKSAGLTSMVRLWGNQSDVGLFLAAADVLLLCSDTEGLPGVLLEAAYFNIPAVAADVGGVSEFIMNGANGLMVPSSEIDAYVSGLNHLLMDTAACATMGQEAKATLRRFDFGIITEKYESVFKRMLMG